MKINGKLDTGGLDKLTTPGKSPAAANTAKTGETAQESAVAALSGRLSDVKAGEAPFDAKRVEEVRQAIREGRFEVNPEAVADSVIKAAKELVGQK